MNNRFATAKKFAVLVALTAALGALGAGFGSGTAMAKPVHHNVVVHHRDARRDIREGNRDIREGLRDILHGNVGEGLRDVGQGNADIREGLGDAFFHRR